MDAATLKAREIEAMTFIFSAPASGTPRRPGPWTRLLEWTRAKLKAHRRSESIAMHAVDSSFPGL